MSTAIPCFSTGGTSEEASDLITAPPDRAIGSSGMGRSHGVALTDPSIVEPSRPIIDPGVFEEEPQRSEDDEPSCRSIDRPVRLTHRDLFVIFFRAGLALGGGLGIMAALEDELVRRRRAVSREDFLATYAMGRLVPSGTMTAVAVAYGHRFGGWIGTVIAMTAMVLPSTMLTILLTMGYGLLHDGPFLGLLSRVVMPAALALIAVPALKFGREVSGSGFDMAVAAASLLAAAGLGLHPSLVLLAGGMAGLVAGRYPSGRQSAGKRA